MKKILLTLLGIMISFSLVEAQFSIAKPVLEDFQGTWCGWCPGGAEVAKDIVATYPNTIIVGVHVGDAMEIPEGAEVDSYFNSSGYPSACINRAGSSLSTNLWKTRVSETTVSSVGISFKGGTYDAATGNFTVDVEGMFTGPETGELRWNLFILEDGVTGYPQQNFYSGDGSFTGHPLYGDLVSLPSVISGYIHEHTLRDMAYGAWGWEGSIAGPVNFGTKITTTMSGTIDPSWDLANIQLVAVIQEYGTGINGRPILNGEALAFEIATSSNNDLVLPEAEVKVYPNPTTDVTRISFNLIKDTQLDVEILDILGNKVQDVASGHQNTGWHTVYWDASNLAEGLYMVHIKGEEGISITKRVMVTK